MLWKGFDRFEFGWKRWGRDVRGDGVEAAVPLFRAWNDGGVIRCGVLSWLHQLDRIVASELEDVMAAREQLMGVVRRSLLLISISGFVVDMLGHIA